VLPLKDKYHVIRGLLCLFRNYTDRDSSARQIASLTHSVQEKEFLLDNRARMAETLLNANPDLVLVIDRGWKLCAANTALQEYSGLTNEQLVGCRLQECFPNVTGTALEPAIEAAFRGETISLERIPCTLKDGECTVSLTPLSFEGLVYGILLSAQTLP
jgi:PAS domain-containing protein